MPLKFNIISRLIDTTRPQHRQRLVDRSERPLDQRLEVYPLWRDGRINRVMHVHKGFKEGQKSEIEYRVRFHIGNGTATGRALATLGKTSPFFGTAVAASLA